MVHRFGDVNPRPLGSTTAGPGHREAELHNRTLCAELHSWMETAGSVGLDKVVKRMPPVTNPPHLLTVHSAMDRFRGIIHPLME